MTLVSVLVPVYNAAAFIEETVQSVLAQTHQDWELLLVDDGSKDATPQVLESLARLDARIRVLRQANAGTQAARNFGLQHCRGEWIALLDHDDTWLPRKLERQLEIARAHPEAALVFCNFARWDGARDLNRRYKSERRLPAGDVHAKLATRCLFGALTVMVKRDELSRAGAFDTRMLRCGDWDMWLRLAEQGVQVRGTLEVLARWRTWHGNLSRGLLAMRREEVLVIEAALQRARTPRLRRLYGAALAARRGNLLMHEALEGGAAGERLAAAAWRAWTMAPRRLRLLDVAVSAAWPRVLGGGRMLARAEARVRRSC